MNSTKLLSRHTLNNSLVLEFWDLSRPMVGDRWQVVVEARVAVAVTGNVLPEDLRPQLPQIISALGEEAVFAKQEMRNFVPTGEVAAILEEITTQLLSSLRGYLGHPDFAARFIRKKYMDHQERKKLESLI